MRRRLTILPLLLTIVMAASAGPIDRREALRRAQAAATEQGRSVAGDGSPVYKAPRRGAPATADGESGSSYYVFDMDGGKGFVIIAGDDRAGDANGVIGMADSGQWDAAALPDNFKAWLDACAEAIGTLTDGDVARAPQQHADVEPMVTATWNQDEPYNGLFATYTYAGATYNYYTGCAITAAAQVMRYHRWPQTATATIPAHAGVAALQPTTFNWDAMKDIYGGLNDTEEEEEAVASLMYYCAQAFKATYTSTGTGATMDNVASALRTCFGYDSGTRMIYRNYYTIDEWDELMYGELREGRPVLYAGYSTGGGHAFVCDGYRSSLYHINWGWGGKCNGYYSLAVLKPEGQGIGGSLSSDGYSMNQQAVVGIQPPVAGGTEAQQTLTAFNMEANGSHVGFSYYNMTGATGTFDVGAILVDGNGQERTLWTQEGIELNPNYGMPLTGDYLSRYSLTAGTYRIYPVSRENGRTEWLRCGPASLYASATVATDGGISVTAHPVVSLTATGITLTGNGIATAEQEVTVTVKNSADEIYDNIYLWVKAPGALKYSQASATGLQVAEDGEASVKLYFTPQTEGTYNLRVCTDDNGENVIGATTADITAAPSAPCQLAMRSVLMMVTGMPNTFTASIINNGTETYLRPVVARLFKDTHDGTGQYKYVEDVEVTKAIEPGEWQQFVFQFGNLIEGENYAIQLLYYNYFREQTADKELTRKFFTATSAIESVIADEAEDDAPFYTLTGRKVNRPTEKGVYIHKGKKVIIK